MQEYLALRPTPTQLRITGRHSPFRLKSRESVHGLLILCAKIRTSVLCVVTVFKTIFHAIHGGRIGTFQSALSIQGLSFVLST